jgi:hypothetical protein
MCFKGMSVAFHKEGSKMGNMFLEELLLKKDPLFKGMPVVFHKEGSFL